MSVGKWSGGSVQKVDHRFEVALHFPVLIVAARDQQQAYPFITAPGKNFLRFADRYRFVVSAVYQQHRAACRADGVALARRSGWSGPPSERVTRQAWGLTFWFKRKWFVGAYLAFICAMR